MVLHISSFHSEAYSFYKEVNYLILFFVATYILKDFIRTRSSYLQASVYVAAFCLVVFKWTHTAVFYSNRISWIDTMAIDNDRRVINLATINNDSIVMPWASAYESILISTLKGRSSTMLVKEDISGFDIEETESKILTEFGEYLLEDVNANYFDLVRKSYEK